MPKIESFKQLQNSLPVKGQRSHKVRLCLTPIRIFILPSLLL